MGDELNLNSLVYDFLETADPKLAKKFKKQVNPTALPTGSPKIADIVKHFETANAQKRKLDLCNGDDTPAKKKKVETNGKKKDDSSSDSDSDEDMPLVKTPAKSAPKPAAKKEESSSSDDDSDEEEVKKPAAKAVAKPVAKKEESSSSDSDSDEEEKKPAAKPVAKPAAKPATKPAPKKDSSSDDSSDEEEEKKPAVKAVAKPAAKAAPKKEESSSDDSSDDEEEKKPAVKAAPKKAEKKEESSSSDDSDDEEEKPAAKAAPKKAAKKESSSSDDSDSDDEAVKKPAAKKEEKVEDDDVEMKVTNNANKSMDAGTPVKINPEEVSEGGCKMFVHGVNEDTDCNDLAAPFYKFGDVTDSFNPGRGFAFITMATPEEAQAAIKGLDGTEVCGRSIQLNLARPKGAPAPPGGGRGAGRGGGRGGRNTSEEQGLKLFVHGVGEEVSSDTLLHAFGKHGNVTDAYNSGRGFAFITYTTAAEANTAIQQMEGAEIDGQYIQVNIAKPKGEAGAVRGGGGRQQAAEGCKLFVHGVSEDTPNEDLQGVFEKHGTVTDTFNPGRGFAFVTFATPAEATKAISALNESDVLGRIVSINVAKPKEAGGGDAGGRGGGRGGRGGRGGTPRGGRGGRGGARIDVGGGGGGNKKMSFDD